MNRIGPFLFRSLAGPIEPPKQSLLPIARPGVRGTGLLRTGVRGAPFTLHSITGVLDLVDGNYTFANYLYLIGDAPQELVRDGLNYAGGESFVVAVLNVRNRTVRKVINDTGLGPFAAILEADWDLIAIETT